MKYQIAGLRIGSEVLPHCLFPLNPSIPHYAVPEVVAEEECEVLKINEIIEFLQAERIEIRMNGFISKSISGLDASYLRIPTRLVIKSLHRELNVFGIQ
jgi:hypothetical protein